MLRRSLGLALAGTAVLASVTAATSTVRASTSVSPAPSAEADARIVISHAAPIRGSMPSIWTVKRDGTQLLELTHPLKGELDQYPSWSHDRGQIAFLRFVPNGKLDRHGEPDGRYDLMVMRADGRGIRRLAPNAFGAGNWYGVAWSPFNSRIAFTRLADHDDWIWTISTTGGGQRKLTRGDCAAWSPDGTEIAFRQWQESQHRSELFVVAAGGGNTRELAPAFAGDTYWCPTWAPDGKTIAFLGTPVGGVSDDVSLYVVNRDGTDLRRLAHGLDSKDTSRAQWSPDGSNLLIERRDGAFVISASGGTAHRVASGTYYPQWSPDGRLIAFEGSTRSNLFVVTPHGGTPTMIVRGVASSFDW
jgi:Tol biopolymer transport system component